MKKTNIAIPHTAPSKGKVLSKRFVRNDRGAIAIMFALMMPFILGVIGLGVEAGMWFKDRRELQSIADSASISAAVENAYGASTTSELTAAAQVEANLNGFDATKDTIVYVGTPQSGAYIDDADYVEVRLSRTLTTIVSQVFKTFDPSTIARAVASTTGDKEACVLALSSTASPGVTISGNSTVNLTNCGLVANSTTASYSVDVCNNCSLTTDCVWASGGINEGLNSITSTVCDDVIPNVDPIADPYVALDVPASFGSCAPNTAMTGGQYIISSNTTLSEGRYCQGLKITNGTVTLNAGTYIMDSGDFNMTGGNLSGSGVTIILTSSTSPANDTGAVSITGNGNVNLSAPTENDTTGTVTGDYQGILVYQDRNVSPPPNAKNKFSGGSTAELAGAIYTPSYDIEFTGGNDTSSTGCMMLIGDSITFNGDADMENDCTAYGGNSLLYGASPRLVE